jgi:predicted amidohydrolase
MKAGFFQFSPVFGDSSANVALVADTIRNREFDLLVLPELFNTGYQFVSQREVEILAEPVPEGNTTSFMAEVSRDRNCYLVFGLAEKAGKRYFNSAVMTGPEGFVGVYRKSHLFYEEKLWFSPGDTGFEVWDTEIGKIGIMVCFDWFFPESARMLSLKGAEVIAHPSNLVLPYCPDSMPLRCLENSVFAITANRTGSENRHSGETLNYIGMSQITGPDGSILYRAGRTNAEVSILDLDVEKARNKNLNQYNNLFLDRRPELYRKITEHVDSPDADRYDS